MRECGQQTYGGCDPSTCDRSCSATIIIPEHSSASLAAFILPAAIVALGFLAFAAAAYEMPARWHAVASDEEPV
jgi:hypothetical protein